MSIYRIDVPATVAAVNAELKRLGCAERLRRGRGYYYFHGGDAAGWYASAVYVNDIRATHLGFWIGEFNNLRADARNTKGA